MSGIRGIAAVVLNYKTWRYAVACVNDLKAQDHPDKHIIVVDNGSGNESAAELKSRFGDDPTVTVLISKKNLGFARGNNLGIRYAHEKLGFDTVFVVNSDTRVEKGLFTCIANTDCSSCGAITPTVLNSIGEPQYYPVNCDDIEKHARRTVGNLIKANIASLPLISKLYERYGKNPEDDQAPVPFEANRYILQGCAYFLTPDFFAHYRGIYPRTFLYWEEVDLMLMLKRAGLGTLCVETPAVTHLGEGSTKRAAKNVERFRLRQSNRSMISSLQLIFGMSEARIRRCIDKSPQFIDEL